MIFRDARHAQLLALALFLLLGVYTRDWTVQLTQVLVIGASCGLTQIGLSLLVNLGKRRHDPNASIQESQQLWGNIFQWLNLDSLKSAMITTLGLCLLLRGNHLSTFAIAGCLAIGGKFILQYKGKHFYNPANFGIIAALLLTHDAWVSPGQWGADSWYLLLFVVIGGLILKKVGRWDTSMVFLITYGGCAWMRNFWLGWSGDVWLHQLMSGSLLVFAFFMITDPRSIPNSATARMIWAFAIAILTFVLQFNFYLTTAPFWALFALSPLTPLLDSLWSAPRFTWRPLNLRLPSPSL